MNKRKKVSGSINFRKYVMSWLILVFAYVITSYSVTNGFWYYFTWTIAILIALVFFSLKKVEFNEDAVFFNGKMVEFESIKDLKVFTINQQPYYLFITGSKSPFQKYFLSQLGGLNYISVAKALLSKKRDTDLPLAEFLHLLDTKSHIKKD
ncbi:hypothetical protein [Winogradskyella flava]|uniref:hypothetical protein n=1 Tax=Winogradskyella flava TaxID=1884876 RepID=UPI0024938B2F|nr:hypothetical protein [Winogradskyella flava]